MNVQVDVQRWSRDDDDWVPFREMLFAVPTTSLEPVSLSEFTGMQRINLNVPAEWRAGVELACHHFEQMARHIPAEEGCYRLGLDLVVEWRNGEVIHPPESGPRDIVCAECGVTFEPGKRSEEVECPECEYQRTEEG
jgi:hypothetical protein